MNNEDMSDVFDKLNNIAGLNNISPEMVNNLFNMLNNSNSSDNNSSNDNHSSNNKSYYIDHPSKIYWIDRGCYRNIIKLYLCFAME